eukprot:Rmarinus@m.4239
MHSQQTPLQQHSALHQQHQTTYFSYSHVPPPHAYALPVSPTISKPPRGRPRIKDAKKKRDENRPKKPMTAYFCFLHHFREAYKRDNPEKKAVKDTTKVAGEKWKEMTDEEKAPYVEKAKQLRAEYEVQKAEYEKELEKTRKPKKPLTGYFLFMADFRKQYKDEHPEEKGVQKLTQAAGMKWKNMTEEEKLPYNEKAQILREEFNRKKAEGSEAPTAAEAESDPAACQEPCQEPCPAP